jgi:hypothetical protein
MTPQENETWAEVTWKPGHGPDDTDAAVEQIREWAESCAEEFSKDRGPSLTDYLVARAISDLAGDWVSRWLIRLAWVILIAGAGAITWAWLA